MKTIILYATKYGASREIAHRISERIDGAETYDLKQDSIPDLAGYDCVIVGSSIYAGMTRKEAKEFLSQSADVLHGKRLGLFISGMSTDNEEAVLAAAFSKELLRCARKASVLGGIFDPKKAGFFERFIMKIVTKKSEYINTIDDGKIDAFVNAVMDGTEGC